MTSRRARVPKVVKFKKVRPAHRPRIENELREVIGASVRAKTRRELARMTARGKRNIGPRWNIGQTIDALVLFAGRKDWKPDDNLERS